LQRNGGRDGHVVDHVEEAASQRQAVQLWGVALCWPERVVLGLRLVDDAPRLLKVEVGDETAESVEATASCDG
jgi:hypothetical protein